MCCAASALIALIEVIEASIKSILENVFRVKFGITSIYIYMYVCISVNSNNAQVLY